MDSSTNQNQEQNFTSIDQIFKEMIDSLPEACKELGEKHIDCLVENSRRLKDTKITETEFLQKYEIEIIPECLKKFNIEHCIVQNTKL